VAKPTRVKRVALAGNPNTGKTTLFNRLTGSDAKVGNYPGVTVEHQEGRLELPLSGGVLLVDVPGTYSLSARSAEEQIAIQAIAGLSPIERPDAVLVVVDATQLTRNLYLVLQVIETGLPVVVAINMIDMLAVRGLSIDTPALARLLGVPVVAISSQSGRGLDELRAALDFLLRDPSRGTPGPRWLPESPQLELDVNAVAAAIPAAWHCDEAQRRRALALWALLSLDEHDELRGASPELRGVVAARRKLAAAEGREIEAEIIQGSLLVDRPPRGPVPRGTPAHAPFDHRPRRPGAAPSRPGVLGLPPGHGLGVPGPVQRARTRPSA
jgi:ferrous iron transport protein B